MHKDLRKVRKIGIKFAHYTKTIMSFELSENLRGLKEIILANPNTLVLLRE
jgi:hypothetical protein